MTWQAWVIGALAAAVVLLAGYAVALRRRARADHAGAGSQAPAAVVAPPTPPQPEVVATPDDGYVITQVGESRDEVDTWRVSDRVVLSATLGEPLVKVIALGHGLRRALSPASRNRIRFEVRQEVRRTRRVRRAEMREAWRAMKAQERAREQQEGAA